MLNESSIAYGVEVETQPDQIIFNDEVNVNLNPSVRLLIILFPLQTTPVLAVKQALGNRWLKNILKNLPTITKGTLTG
jgi:hypothetical protein